MSTRRLAPLTALFVMLVMAAPAMAAPTASQITTPSGTSFPVFTHDNPNTLHVEGTTSGGTGDVDLRCYYGAAYKAIATNVPVVAGSFSTDAQMSALVASYPYPFCTLRAVPAATTPADLGPFQGPRIGPGYFRTFTIQAAGGAVNAPDTIRDYWIAQTQSGAQNDYDSAGSCGLCDTFLIDPATGATSNGIWWANAALYSRVPSAPTDVRSEVRIDGVDAYNPAGIPTALRDNPGLPELTFSSTVDPANGDLTIEETDPFVTCSPHPAVYPMNEVDCSSFSTPKVKLVRKWIQRRDGRQVTLVDSWQSLDSAPHQLEAWYDQTATSKNYQLAGHTGRWNFTWTGEGFKAYPVQTPIPAPPAGSPATYFVKGDATTPDAGDGKNPIGAVTLGTTPDEIIVREASSAANSVSHWEEHYNRTIPASGELKIEYVYSHDYSLASVQALAADAEQAFGGSASPPPAGDPAPAPVVAPPPAAVPPPPPVAPPATKCRVPKLRGKTLRRSRVLLRRAHCRLGVVTRRTTSKVAARRVLLSRPRAGTLRSRGARVRLVLAR